MNDELKRQKRALIDEENKHNTKATAALRAVQPRRGNVVDRKLLDIAERELAQAEFARALQSSCAYRVEG